MSEINERREQLSEAQRALLKKRLQGRNATAASSKPIITKLEGSGPAPASFGQQRLWFLHQLNPQSAAYNMVNAVRIQGELNSDLVERSLQVVVARHEALRTTFAMHNDQLVQVVHDEMDIPLNQRNINSIDSYEAAIVAVGQEPFDLAEGPLVHAELISNQPNDAMLVLVIHHIVCDEWSVDLIWQEMNAVYTALAAGKSPELTDLPIQYGDYAAWQHQQTDNGAYDKQVDYWQKKLAGDLPLLQLPSDHQRPGVQRFQGHLLVCTLPHGLSAQLNQLSKDAGATLNMTLQAAFTVLLHRYSGQDDVLVGTPVANRKQAEVEKLIGFFLNTVVLRSDFSEPLSFRDYLSQLRQQSIEALTNSDVPFDTVIEAIKPQRSPSHNPIFQAMFVYNDQAAHQPTLPDLTLTPMLVDMGVSKFDVTLFAQEQDGAIQLGLEYNADLFDSETMQRFLAHYETLLESIVADPDTLVGKLNILPEAEHDLLLSQWANVSSEAIEDVTLIPELIASHAANAIAIQQGDVTLTYGDLNQHANQLAHFLTAKGLQPDMAVGLCVERSPEMLIGILGILKAGAAYVPIDPDYPAERVDYILKDAGISLLLTSKALAEHFAEDNVEVIALDDATTFMDQSTTAPEITIEADRLAYMIYTSGSTGKPKGVRISHRNLAHSTVVRFSTYPHPVERFLLLSSFAFDSSLVGIFWTLAAGGTLVLPPHQGERDIPHIADLIQDHQITHLLALPSLYQILLEYADPIQLRSLNTVMVAGEACSLAVVRQHYASIPSAKLYNEYGPTEGTVWSTVWEIPQDAERILIGRPIPNVQVYILNPHQQPAPIGVVGELYIGGAGIAMGYHNRPDLTAERFIDNPFGAGRLYRTGDLVRFVEDGQIEFLGRVDYQVKISGYRIELGEIEQALTAHEAVREAVVLALDAGETESQPDIYDLALQVEQQNALDILQQIEAMSDAEADAILRNLIGEHDA